MGIRVHFGVVFLLTITVSMVFVPFFQNSFAAEGWFEPHQRELYQQPTVCIFQPDDVRVDENRWERWFADSKAVIDEWETILKQRETSTIGKWNIEVVKIPLDRQHQYDSAGCNIEIHFTILPLEFGVLGWYWIGKGTIEIVTTQSEYCGKKYFPEYGLNFQVYCYKDTLERSKKIAAVLKHELGHAFGLGHYVTADSALLESWQNNPLGQPSIMTFAHHNEEQMRIQEIDIKKLQEIHGGVGFGNTKNTIPVFVEPEPEPEYDFDKPYRPSGNVVEVNYGVISIHKISGTVPESNYMAGKQVEFYIKHPDSSVETSKVRVTKDMYYEYPLAFDFQSERGHYQIIVKYRDIEIKTTDFYVKTKSKSPTPEQPFRGPPNLPVDNDMEIMTNIKMATSKQKLDEINLMVLEIESSLSGLEYQNLDAEKKLESAWGMRWTAVEHKQVAERLWDAGNYELESNDSEQALAFFEGVNSHHELVEKLVRRISAEIYEADKLEGKTINDNRYSKIPDWIQKNAKWWTEGSIDDESFVGGIQYLIKEKVISVQTSQALSSDEAERVPEWIKNNAGWWADGLISEDDFLKGIEYMIEHGIIKV